MSRVKDDSEDVLMGAEKVLFLYPPEHNAFMYGNGDHCSYGRSWIDIV